MADNPMAESGTIHKAEKAVFYWSAVFIVATIGLIGYANWGMGIHVPSCVPQEKLFDHGAVAKQGDKHYEVRFLAKMWAFEPSRVRVPVGSTVDVALTSKDVTHGFQILGTNVNLMAVPGVVTPSSVHFSKPGVYPIVCHEYCGAAHEKMNAVIEVTSDVTDIAAEGIGSPDAARKLLDEKGCTACHSLDGTASVGPTLKGLWGEEATLADGTKRHVDGDFVKAMIQHPEKYPIKGYDPIMPAVPLTDEEIKLIEEYLEGLK
jgi:cytochrome c oxidase subunit 2